VGRYDGARIKMLAWAVSLGHPQSRQGHPDPSRNGAQVAKQDGGLLCQQAKGRIEGAWVTIEPLQARATEASDGLVAPPTHPSATPSVAPTMISLG